MAINIIVIVSSGSKDELYSLPDNYCIESGSQVYIAVAYSLPSICTRAIIKQLFIIM